MSLFRLDVVFLALILFAWTGHASNEITYLGPTERALASYFGPYDSPVGKSSRQPLNIVREGPSDIIIIFGAANAPGKFGAYFRTDLLVSGSGVGNGSIVFSLWVLPANTDNRNAIGRRYSVHDNVFQVMPDVVGSFGVTGSATLVIVVDAAASTAIGAHSLLSAWGRTWTAGPEGGAYSTTLPATFGWIVSSTTFADTPGAVVDGSKRTNVGCFNHGSSTATCHATVYGTDGSVAGQINFSIPPLSSLQQGLTGYNLPEPGGDVLFSTTSGFMTGYIVVDDNVTNDGDLFLASYREASACPNVSGTWGFYFCNRCGYCNTGIVVVAQSGCSFTAATPIGSFSGTLYGNNGQFDINPAPCSGSASGIFTVYSSQGVSGTFSGTVSGAGCCGPSLSGSFTLGR